MGMQEYEAKQYKEKMKGGNILISVHYRGWNRAQSGEEIFKNAGRGHGSRRDCGSHLR
jgi:hypothetical protein